MKVAFALPVLLVGIPSLVSACGFTPRDYVTWCFINGLCDPFKGKICQDHPCKGGPPEACLDFTLCTGQVLMSQCISGDPNLVTVCNDDETIMKCDGKKKLVRRYAPTCDFMCDPPTQRRELQLEACTPILGLTRFAGGGGSCVCNHGSDYFCAT
jgi:hypothetical protein